METEKSLVKAAETRLPKFVEDAYESIDKMEKFANILLESKLVPNHFYEQLPDKKPDFSKGKTPAVVAVLIQGYQLQLPPLTALQHIIPVNGLLSIKGDLAKSMIFNSGKLKPGSWEEEETGSIEAGDYMVKITATRADNGQTLSRSFSVAQAKRAGLWITEQQVNGQDGWKYKSSAWWKYPSRMINYRALGFLARDMFPDVMAGIYTTEEAMDISKDSTEVIETESGAKITLPDKDHSKGRSEKMTSRVADKIKSPSFTNVNESKNNSISEAEIVPEEKYEPKTSLNDVMDAMKSDNQQSEETPFIASKGSVEYMDGKEISRDGVKPEEKPDAPIIPGQLTIEQMSAMETSELLKIVNEDMDMMDACEIIGGKNTNKKLRDIIFAHQKGQLAQHVAPYIKENTDKKEDQSPTTENAPADTAKGEIPVNKDFEKASEPTKNADLFQSDKKSGNKYGIEIAEVGPQGNRDFSETKKLFNQLAGVSPSINAQRFLELAGKLGYDQRFKDKEVFCRAASVVEIDALLNAN